MTKQAIQYCEECEGEGCAPCDHQGSWEGDWRCDCCDTLIGAQEGYCPSCEEQVTCHAGAPMTAAESRYEQECLAADARYERQCEDRYAA